jgi:hypothetical protein
LSPDTTLVARSRRTSAALNLPMLLGAFQPPKPDNRICCGTHLMVTGHNKMQASAWFSAQGKTSVRPRGRKAPSSMGKLSAAEVLRLRATSALSRDKSVRRSAQDDDFVGVLTKNILDKLALMGHVSALTAPNREQSIFRGRGTRGLHPGVIFSRPSETRFGESSSHAGSKAHIDHPSTLSEIVETQSVYSDFLPLWPISKPNLGAVFVPVTFTGISAPAPCL